MDLLVLYGQNPEDIATWDDLVDRAPIPDVYYRPAYLRAYALTGHGRPVAVVVRSGSTEALFPLLIRKLDIDGQVVRDAITPYGYGGLLRLSGPEYTGSRNDAPDCSGNCGIGCAPPASWPARYAFIPCLDQDAAWCWTDAPRNGRVRFPRGQTTAIELKCWDDIRHRVLGMNERTTV